MIWRKGIGGDAEKSNFRPQIENRSLAGNATFSITAASHHCLSHHCLPSQSVPKTAQKFLIVCCPVVYPAGFLGARSGVHGTLQGQCCCLRLRVAQLQVNFTGIQKCPIWLIVTKKIWTKKIDLGRGSGGRRKCRWPLWWVRPRWKGQAEICKQSECQRASQPLHLILLYVPNRISRVGCFKLDFVHLSYIQKIKYSPVKYSNTEIVNK